MTADVRNPSPTKFRLSAAVVQRLLPIRPPYLMIDRVDAFDPGATPTLRSSRALSVNDPVFVGHFPDLAVLPGAQILESMAQSSGVLAAIVLVQRAFESAGHSPDEALEALLNLDRGLRLDPRYRPALDIALVTALQGLERGRVGMLASSQLKFLHPVFPGDHLEFVTRAVRESGSVWHFEVDAEVGGAPVARGALTTALVSSRLPATP